MNSMSSLRFLIWTIVPVVLLLGCAAPVWRT